jgi:sugar phosphate isomerase/epimerase
MIIAVDFDGTIVTHEYPKIGKEIPFAIDVLKRLQQEEHHVLLLWTVRSGKLLDEAVEYCRERGLEFYAANKNYPEEDARGARKLDADMFIDDRNVGGLMDWGRIYRSIKGTPDGEEYEFPKQKKRDPRKPKNIILRFGEWLDRLGDEIDKRR